MARLARPRGPLGGGHGGAGEAPGADHRRAEEELEASDGALQVRERCVTPIADNNSAGVGRTGTIIAIHLLLQQFRQYQKSYTEQSPEEKKKYRFSIFGVVRRLREQRWGMVNTGV